MRSLRDGVAIVGPLSFWAGMVMSARGFPSEYDWRYTAISDLLSPDRDPAGFAWGTAGIVFCGLCGIFWSTASARRGTEAGGRRRPAGLRSVRLGCICMVATPIPLPAFKGHEIVAVMALASLSIGLVSLTRHVFDCSRRLHRYSAAWAGLAMMPLLLLGVVDLDLAFNRPQSDWVSLAWRSRGIPAYLSFAFWEWIMAAAVTVYVLAVVLALRLSSNAENA